MKHLQIIYIPKVYYRNTTRLTPITLWNKFFSMRTLSTKLFISNWLSFSPFEQKLEIILMLFVSRKKCLAKCGNWTSMYVFYVYYFLRILEIQSLLHKRIIERVLTGISTFLATSKFSWRLLLWVYQSNSFYVIALVH